MIFLGTTFCGAKYCADSTPNPLSTISSITLTNGVFDTLFGTKSMLVDWSGQQSYPWDYDTVIFADFENTLLAGNVDFSVSAVSSIKIKRRKIGTYKYQTFYEIPINSADDLKFERFDFTAASNTEYEYALVPCINGAEGNYNKNTILSKFDGLFILDIANIYQAILNLELTHQRNRTGESITTLGRRTPYYISNGLQNYESGTIKATFAELIGCDWDFENGWKYRDRVNDFLTNGMPKIIKNDEGKMWLVHICTDSIQEDHSSHRYNVIHSFKWEETGDVEDVDDLYEAGLLSEKYYEMNT